MATRRSGGASLKRHVFSAAPPCWRRVLSLGQPPRRKLTHAFSKNRRQAALTAPLRNGGPRASGALIEARRAETFGQHLRTMFLPRLKLVQAFPGNDAKKPSPPICVKAAPRPAGPSPKPCVRKGWGNTLELSSFHGSLRLGCILRLLCCVLRRASCRCCCCCGGCSRTQRMRQAARVARCALRMLRVASCVLAPCKLRNSCCTCACARTWACRKTFCCVKRVALTTASFAHVRPLPSHVAAHGAIACRRACSSLSPQASTHPLRRCKHQRHSVLYPVDCEHVV